MPCRHNIGHAAAANHAGQGDIADAAERGIGGQGNRGGEGGGGAGDIVDHRTPAGTGARQAEGVDGAVLAIQVKDAAAADGDGGGAAL